MISLLEVDGLSDGARLVAVRFDAIREAYDRRKLETVAKLIVTTGPAGTSRESLPFSIHVYPPRVCTNLSHSP